jgi:hypothetical protein
MKGQSKSSWNSLTYMVWRTMGLYSLNRVLLVISTCKVCRGCATQFGESSMISDRGSGFCIMITHQDTRRLLCSNSSPRKTSSHHLTTKFSGSRSEWHFSVPYCESGPQGDRFHNHGGHQIKSDSQMLEDSKRSLPPVLPTMAGASVFVCACVCVCTCTPPCFLHIGRK